MDCKGKVIEKMVLGIPQVAHDSFFPEWDINAHWFLGNVPIFHRDHALSSLHSQNL
jgi:hypothetical protein